MSNLTGEQEFNERKAELEKDLEARINADNLPVANIMVAGITGTGKSTLINAVFGEELAATGTGRPVTERIDEYQTDNLPIHIWDTVGLELDSDKTRDSINSIKKTIADRSTLGNLYGGVHAIWYCVNSGSNRYQGAELDFIKELHQIGVPFIIVLTQCSGDEGEVNAFEGKIKEINKTMGMEDIRIVQVLARPVKYRGFSEPIPAFGLEELVTVTTDLLPGFIKKSFVASQQVSQKLKRNQCEEIIYTHVLAAQNGFWDRVPLVNVILTNGKVKKMFSELGQMYNTVLSPTVIDRVVSTHIDFPSTFFGLISPIDMGYSKKVSALLNQKKESGYEVRDIPNNARAARMIAFYGYTFMDSIEELWQKFTEYQLKDVDTVVDILVGIINRKLQERKDKVKECEEL